VIVLRGRAEVLRAASGRAAAAAGLYQRLGFTGVTGSPPSNPADHDLQDMIDGIW
jgi:hypothetical protein